MPTRRSFLQSALLLPSLFAVDAFAQDNASASFADFESGDYSDWTITGDAFGSRPATDALFPGKVRGFGGKSYASTFSPRRGVLATGKAVSREFTIEKPVITFKIGGGNHPGKACLNLVVDGKVERTETGDGSAQLLARSWDVSGLLGKRARLEIVDDTASDQRGYVMVDDIAFGEKLDSRQQEAFGKYVKQFRAAHSLPALVASISGKQVVVAIADGVRELGKPDAITLSDTLRVGSISKTITATLVGVLVEKGIFKWETTVGNIFPEYHSRFNNHQLLSANLLHLMCHRAGIEGQSVMYGKYANLPSPQWRLRLLEECLTKTPSAALGEKYI